MSDNADDIKTRGGLLDWDDDKYSFLVLLYHILTYILCFYYTFVTVSKSLVHIVKGNGIKDSSVITDKTFR